MKNQEFMVDKAYRLFKVYKVESFDSELMVILNLDNNNFYPNDILKVNLNDKIYFDYSYGWYLHLNENNLVNIEVQLFQELKNKIMK